MSRNQGRSGERDNWNTHHSRVHDLDALRERQIAVVEGTVKQDIDATMATAERLAIEAVREDHSELSIPTIFPRRGKE